MREILFRAKVQFERLISAKPNEKKEQVIKWVYWGEYGQMVAETGCAIPYNIDGLRVIYIDTARKCIIYETVGQYTGLVDKNGKKIFEGDIVIAPIFYDMGCYPHTEKRVVEVKIPHIYKMKIDGDLEIVGNIHDNPELLNTSQTERGE